MFYVHTQNTEIYNIFNYHQNHLYTDEFVQILNVFSNIVYICIFLFFKYHSTLKRKNSLNTVLKAYKIIIEIKNNKINIMI